MVSSSRAGYSQSALRSMVLIRAISQSSLDSIRGVNSPPVLSAIHWDMAASVSGVAKDT